MIFGCLQCYNCIAFHRPAEVTALQVLLTALLRGRGTYRFSLRKGRNFPVNGFIRFFAYWPGLLCPGLILRLANFILTANILCAAKIF